MKSSRASGRSAPAATGTSPLPTNSRTRSAFAVVFSSVWLPATVVTPRSSSSGLASARRSAIASSWPGSQSSKIGLLMSSSISSTSAAVGSDGCAPGLDAAIAPAAQARRRASSRSRPSSRETTRQAVKASPAAVPSTAWTGGGAARATSTPSSRRSAPSAPSVSAKSAPIGLDPSASSSSELATIRSARSRIAPDTGRAGAAFRQKNASVCRSAASIGSSRSSSWQMSGVRLPHVDLRRVERVVRPRDDDDLVLAGLVDEDERDPRRSPCDLELGEVDSRGVQLGRACRPKSSSPTAPTKRTCAPRRAAATAWFAPFPPGT